VAQSEILATPIFRVEDRTVTNGDESFTRSVVVHAGAVAIMAVRDDGRVGMLRHYRATFNDVTWELPAGTRDVPDEEPRATAERELLEELGCHATSISKLYEYMNSRGWTNQVTTIFEASGLTFSDRRPDGPEEVASEVHWMDDDQLRDIVRGGNVVESSTLIAILHRIGPLM
jgi:8-oxo-dGTP pyrophosphatase MutT (NUDIX family)